MIHVSANRYRRRPMLGNESGAILILVAFLSFAALAIVALVIDQARQVTAINQLQIAADAASHAATMQLRGDVEGWRRAKRAALAILAEHKITSVTTNIVKPSFTLSTGISDPTEDAQSVFRYNEGVTDSDITVTIERGRYGYVPEPTAAEQGTTTPGQYFTSSEQLNSNGDELTYALSNAVRVSVKLSHIDNSFGGTIGFARSGELTAKGVAKAGDTLDAEVLPVAIPLCAIMQQVNPYPDSKFLTDDYDGLQQCGREVLAVESDPEGLLRHPDIDPRSPEARENRKAGLTRFESFLRYPVAEFSYGQESRCYPGNYSVTLNATDRLRNCRAKPIRAVLGLPDKTEHGAVAGAVLKLRLVEIMSGNKLKASIGQYFRPIEDPSGFSPNNDPIFEQSLANLINQSANPTFNEVFMPTDPATGQASRAPNFPFLPHLLDSARYNAMSAQEQRFYPAPHPTLGYKDAFHFLRRTYVDTYNRPWSLLMYPLSDMGDSKHTNPMCHSDKVYGDDKPNIPNRVFRTTLMVIHSDTHNYCDFDSMFNYRRQESYGVWAGTKPRVVGYVKATLLDFNIVNLTEAPHLNTPHFGDAETDPNTPLLYKVDDVNPWTFDITDFPAFSDFIDKVKNYPARHREYVSCINSTPVGTGTCVVPEVPDATPFTMIPGYLRQCFLVPAIADWDTLREMLAIPDFPDCTDCVIDSDWFGEYICDWVCRCCNPALEPGDDGEGCNGCFKRIDIDYDAAYLRVLNWINGTPWFKPLRRDDHCLAQPVTPTGDNPNQYNLSLGEAWSHPQPRTANVGCGGLRLRLDCGDRFLATGLSPMGDAHVHTSLVE